MYNICVYIYIYIYILSDRLLQGPGNPTPSKRICLRFSSCACNRTQFTFNNSQQTGIVRLKHVAVC